MVKRKEPPLETETEYAGKVPTKNSVTYLGPDPLMPRPLENHERLRLQYLTGQDEDPEADAKPYFMAGGDPDFIEEE